jgi:hypothetical protein
MMSLAKVDGLGEAFVRVKKKRNPVLPGRDFCGRIAL